MPQRKLVLAALLLLGMAMATIEESFVHEDDGCVLETHCNACLLALGSAGIVTAAFSLAPVLAPAEPVVEATPASHEEAPVRAFGSRGPPLA